jgi:hypothetical protein
MTAIDLSHGAALGFGHAYPRTSTLGRLAILVSVITRISHHWSTTISSGFVVNGSFARSLFRNQPRILSDGCVTCS